MNAMRQLQLPLQPWSEPAPPHVGMLEQINTLDFLPDVDDLGDKIEESWAAMSTSEQRKSKAVHKALMLMIREKQRLLRERQSRPNLKLHSREKKSVHGKRQAVPNGLKKVRSAAQEVAVPVGEPSMMSSS